MDRPGPAMHSPRSRQIRTFALPGPCPARLRLELRAAAEPEHLRAVAGLAALRAVFTVLLQRISEVEAQRSERRIPEQTDTDRGAGLADAVETRRHRFTGHVPRRRTLIAPDVTRIGEGRDLDADFLRQEVQRRLEFDAGAPEVRAAKRVVVGAAREIARTDAARGEAANQVRTHLEMIQHAQVLAAPARDVAALQLEHADDIRNDFVVGPHFAGGAQEVHVAADAGEVLLQFGIETAGRALVVVERVVG